MTLMGTALSQPKARSPPPTDLGGQPFLVKLWRGEAPLNMPRADLHMEMRLEVGPGAQPRACGLRAAKYV